MNIILKDLKLNFRDLLLEVYRRKSTLTILNMHSRVVFEAGPLRYEIKTEDLVFLMPLLPDELSFYFKTNLNRDNLVSLINDFETPEPLLAFLDMEDLEEIELTPVDVDDTLDFLLFI